MCAVCKRIRATDMDPQQALANIADAVKHGRDPEHFKQLTDELLGTEEPEVDEEKDDAFERAYRAR